MALIEKHLFIKRSGIPKAGKGLFTKQRIPKGTRITEFKGKLTTWKKVLQDTTLNGYIYYVSSNRVIDAMNYKKAFARYPNDARGLTRIKGLTNNTAYVMEGRKVYMEATKNIPAGAEIFISYGKEYWGVIRSNDKLSLKKK